MQRTSFKEYKDLILDDAARIKPSIRSRKDRWLLILIRYRLIPSFNLIFWYRLTGYLRAYKKYLPLYLFALWRYKKHRNKLNIELSLDAKIGGGLSLAHNCSVIGSYALIGSNLTVMGGVTIGNVQGGTRHGAPVIGNNVLLGAGSIVIGKVVVGNNVCVGAGAVVTSDVPDGACVAGNPAKIISFNGTKVVSHYIQ